jgi:hypothetical protein
VEELARKTSRRGSMGRKNFLLVLIQRERSRARPPAGTTQWMWGWKRRVWVQVCKTAVKPMRALSLERASSIKVSEAARKRRSRHSSAARRNRGCSAPGIVKTMWK